MPPFFQVLLSLSLSIAEAFPSWLTSMESFLTLPAGVAQIINFLSTLLGAVLPKMTAEYSIGHHFGGDVFDQAEKGRNRNAKLNSLRGNVTNCIYREAHTVYAHGSACSFSLIYYLTPTHSRME